MMNNGYPLEDERLEPTNHPLRKEHDLPNLQEIVFHPLIFMGVNVGKKRSQSQGSVIGFFVFQLPYMLAQFQR